MPALQKKHLIEVDGVKGVEKAFRTRKPSDDRPEFRCPYHYTKVRGSDKCTLSGSKIEAEKEFFMVVLESDHKRPFYCAVIEVKSFKFTSESS